MKVTLYLHYGCLVLSLGNSILCEFVKEVKYLGAMIHSSMKTTIDVDRQTRKFTYRLIYCYVILDIILIK